MIATLSAQEGALKTAQELVAPVADRIRRTAPEAEATRRLPDDFVRLLKDAGLFSIYTPKQFGGLELPLPEALRVVEEVSRHDGSTGWTVALGVANSQFTSVLTETSAARVLRNGAALISAAPAFGVRAMRVDGGYRLTGRWAYNSGAPNADWMVAAAPIFEGDQPRIGESGPELVIAFVPPAEVEIIDTWYVTGLRATGTQDLYVDNVYVSDEMSGLASMPQGVRAVRESALNRFPFFSLVGLVQAPPVCLGLARRAVEEFRELASTKQSAFGGPRLAEQVQAQVGLARAEALVQSARAYWYDQVQMGWDTALHAREFTLEDRAAARIASLTAAEQSVAAVDMLYRLAGSTAIFQSSPLERCFRDVHTAAQHLQVQEGRWEAAGRVLMGLEPGSPVL